MSSKKLGLDISLFERLVEHTSQLKPHQLLVCACCCGLSCMHALCCQPSDHALVWLEAVCSKQCEMMAAAVMQVQRRMRPAIADMIRKEIYPSLKDGPNVQHYPDVSGEVITHKRHARTLWPQASCTDLLWTAACTVSASVRVLPIPQHMHT